VALRVVAAVAALRAAVGVVRRARVPAVGPAALQWAAAVAPPPEPEGLAVSRLAARAVAEQW
jgi:hypothetical protein